ncbi:MAG: flippase-like domain-containing protein [Myxococcales bacterium]|nr:flippase-like domain-containing protein [Myxococcales bacterium]
MRGAAVERSRTGRDPKQLKSSLEKLEYRLIWGVILGVGVYAILAVGFADLGEVSAEFSRFGWGTFAAALGLAFTNYLIRFLKWQYYLSRLGIRIPTGESFLVFLSSFVLTVTPGKVGEVLKSYFLRRTRGIPVSRTAPIVVAERLTDLLSLMAIAVVGLSTYALGVRALAVCAGLIALGIVVLSTPRAALATIALVRRLPMVGRIAPKLEVAYESMRALIGPVPLLVATALGVVGWGLEALALYLLIGGFPGTEPSLLAASFLYALTTILGAVSFLPGGLGVTDGSLTFLLTEVGSVASRSMAVAVTFLIRLATLWFAVFVGFAALFIYRRRYLVGTASDSDSSSEEGDPGLPVS